jgi:hypothetical protein
VYADNLSDDCQAVIAPADNPCNDTPTRGQTCNQKDDDARNAEAAQSKEYRAATYGITAVGNQSRCSLAPGLEIIIDAERGPLKKLNRTRLYKLSTAEANSESRAAVLVLRYLIIGTNR